MTTIGCICLGTNPRYLNIGCPNVSAHEEWAARERRPVMYPRGTFPVEPRCVCRGNARYYSVRCPDVADHRKWSELSWYDDVPPFAEPYVIAAREYHAEVMAAVEAATGRGPGYWWHYRPPGDGVSSPHT